MDKSQNLVRFIQLTRGDSHSFIIGFFENFLKTLLESKESFEIKTLEIVFLVDQKKLSDFRISDVTGQGLLAQFNGWEKVKEMDKVEILGIKGI